MTNIIDYKIPLDESKMKDIIDSFVSVYGEERRMEIEKRISNSHIFILKTDKELKEETNESKDKIRDLRYESFKNDLKGVNFVSPLEDESMANLKDAVNEQLTSFCTPLFVNTENGIGLNSIICIKPTDDKNYLDQVIFHELNHAITTYMNSLPFEEKCEITSGWQKLTLSTKDAKEVPGSQNEIDNELFDEILNDLVAEQAARIFHSKGNSIISDPKNAIYVKKNDPYRDNEFIIKDFYETYQEDIIKSRFDGSTELFDRIGIENLENLNELVNKYQNSNNKLSAALFQNVRMIEENRPKIEALREELKSKTVESSREILEKMKLNELTEEKSSGMGM